MTVVVAEGLTKIYGAGPTALTAVDGASLTVDAGEVVLLLGPSGSGKTTLLSMIGGLLRPTMGSASLRGQPLAGSPRELARVRLSTVGFVFQTFNLLAGFSAIENVALPLRLLGVPGRDATMRAAGLLERLGLGDRLSASPKTLSGGEKQRVSLARALAAEPAVLLADEPTASLDTRTGRGAMEVLTSSVRAGRQACLVVTHDTRLVDFADRVLKIEDGRISGGRRGRAKSRSGGGH
jgi:putative ABC transport system ATP-binding protein